MELELLPFYLASFFKVSGIIPLTKYGGCLGVPWWFGLITEPLGFVQDAQAVMVLFDEWLGVLGSGVFVVWTLPLQDDTPVCHDCLVVNGTGKFIINISSRHDC